MDVRGRKYIVDIVSIHLLEPGGRETHSAHSTGHVGYVQVVLLVLYSVPFTTHELSEVIHL